jgi:hypothetical protein
VFGALAISTTSDAAVGGSSIDLGASLGYQIPVGNSARFHLCPVANFGLGLGPKNTFNSGVDRSSRAASIGIALATSLLAAPRVKIVPMLGLGYGYRQAKAENTAGVDLFEITESYAQLQLGVGLVLNSNISVRPGVDFSLGLEATDPTFGITVGYIFGRKRSHGRFPSFPRPKVSADLRTLRSSSDLAEPPVGPCFAVARCAAHPSGADKGQTRREAGTQSQES